MKGNWKKFTVILSLLLVLIIACTSVNVIIDKKTQKIAKKNSAGSDSLITFDFSGETIDDFNTYDGAVADNSGTDSSANQQGNGAVADNGTSNNGGANTQSNTGGNTTGGSSSGGTSTGGQTVSDPTTYSKSDAISYYNNSLKRTYTQSSFTVTKTEVVDVQIKSLLLNGKQSDFLQNAANSVLESNKKKAAKNSGTKSFSGGKIADSERYILPISLYSDAVKSYSVSKNGSGYIVNFTLKAEKCNYTTKPPYNSSCTFPLDINEVDLGSVGQINSADFYYPGTTLQATIDGNGRVVKTYVVMPLNVTNASGQGAGQTVTAEISGQWLCTNVFSF